MHGRLARYQDDLQTYMKAAAHAEERHVYYRASIPATIEAR